MEVLNSYQNTSSLHAEISLKKSQLSSIDKKEEQKSLFEKQDTISSTPEHLDENDYKRVLNKYKDLDSQIKIHEQSHASVAPTLGAIEYSYHIGPDGRSYVNGGSVRFETSIPKDEAEASVKFDKLEKASSAPNELSYADANISRIASLNKMLLQSQGEKNAN